MRRVKTFEEDASVKNLDEAINEWIEVNVDAVGGTVLSVQYAVVREEGQGKYTALLFYEEP